MTLRDAAPADYLAILELHAAQGIECPMPKPDAPSVMALKVVEDEGRIVAAVFAVRAAEIVLAVDHEWRTPRLRWTVIEAMQQALARTLRGMAVDCGYCWLAPPYARGFGRKLQQRLGWTEPVWKCLQRKVEP